MFMVLKIKMYKKWIVPLNVKSWKVLYNYFFKKAAIKSYVNKTVNLLNYI